MPGGGKSSSKGEKNLEVSENETARSLDRVYICINTIVMPVYQDVHEKHENRPLVHLLKSDCF